MTQAVTQGSTSTYAYDYAGNRVSQVVGNTTTIYPSKFYSITSTTNGGTTYATTTVYVWNGDTLIATIDQPMVNGAATGTAATRYIHPDHLGSTNVVTDESGNVVDTLEYYPYGETRINQPTYPTNEARQYIAQFKDGNSLSYLNARYLNSQQGQFLSEDPVFLGDPSQQALSDPQSLNAYSYAEDDPVVKKDPNGRCVGPLVAVCITGAVGAVGGVVSQGYSDYLTGDAGNRTWQQNLATYGIAAGSGTIIGAGTAAAALAAGTAGLGAGATAVAVGGTAGVLNGGTTVAGNYYLGVPTDPTALALNSGLAALTAGTLSRLPQVPGRLPSFGSTAFFTGAHTQRQAAEELFSNSVQAFSQSVNRFVSTQSYSGGVSHSGGGGGSLGGLIQQLQSVVNALQSYVSSLSVNKSTK
jgi:RHS repeat-associated protein